MEFHEIGIIWFGSLRWVLTGSFTWSVLYFKTYGNKYLNTIQIDYNAYTYTHTYNKSHTHTLHSTLHHTQFTNPQITNHNRLYQPLANLHLMNISNKSLTATYIMQAHYSIVSSLDDTAIDYILVSCLQYLVQYFSSQTSFFLLCFEHEKMQGFIKNSHRADCANEDMKCYFNLMWVENRLNWSGLNTSSLLLMSVWRTPGNSVTNIIHHQLTKLKTSTRLQWLMELLQHLSY